MTRCKTCNVAIPPTEVAYCGECLRGDRRQADAERAPAVQIARQQDDLVADTDAEMAKLRARQAKQQERLAAKAEKAREDAMPREAVDGGSSSAQPAAEMGAKRERVALETGQTPGGAPRQEGKE